VYLQLEPIYLRGKLIVTIRSEGKSLPTQISQDLRALWVCRPIQRSPWRVHKRRSKLLEFVPYFHSPSKRTASHWLKRSIDSIKTRERLGPFWSSWTCRQIRNRRLAHYPGQSICVEAISDLLLPGNLAECPLENLEIHWGFWIYQRDSQKRAYLHLGRPDFYVLSPA
jgi:hypothetical protein